MREHPEKASHDRRPNWRNTTKASASGKFREGIVSLVTYMNESNSDPIGARSLDEDFQ
jgi:hypothetical protein